MNNYFCFSCQERFTSYQQPNISFTNSYGDWSGIQHFCGGQAKYIGSKAPATNDRKIDRANQRRKYKDDLTQPYLPDGSFNGRFRDLYPNETKKYVEEGNVTKEEVKKAKTHKYF